MKKVLRHIRFLTNDTKDALGFPLRFSGREGEVQIICFHGVCEDERKLINGRFMHFSRFRQLLEGIRTHFHVLSYQDFLNGKRDPNRLNVLLTFDDGYANFKSLALPVLEELQLHALLFITAPAAPALWNDLFDLASAHPALCGECLERSMPVEAPESYKEWRKWIVHQNAETVRSFSATLYETLSEQLLNENEVFWKLLSDSDLQELQRSEWVTLGNHSANHLNYEQLTVTEQELETRRADERLRSVGRTGELPFAYPYGLHTADSVKNLRNYGYSVQFAGEQTNVSGLYLRLTVHPTFSTGNQLRFIYRGYFR